MRQAISEQEIGSTYRLKDWRAVKVDAMDAHGQNRPCNTIQKMQYSAQD